jgi:hypothetical protein
MPPCRGTVQAEVALNPGVGFSLVQECLDLLEVAVPLIRRHLIDATPLDLRFSCH